MRSNVIITMQVEALNPCVYTHNLKDSDDPLHAPIHQILAGQLNSALFDQCECLFRACQFTNLLPAVLD